MKASKENTRKESKISTTKQSQAQTFNSNYQSRNNNKVYFG